MPKKALRYHDKIVHHDKNHEGKSRQNEKNVNIKRFVEIVPIDYSGTLGILKKEDYLATPANVASEIGYKTTIVSTAQLTTGIFLPKSGRMTNPDVEIKRITGWIEYLQFLYHNRNATIFANDRVAKSLICCYFGKYNIFMSHQSRLPPKWWQRQIFRFFVKRFDAIKVSNPFEKDELVRIGVNPKKVHYIPLTIEHEFYSANVGNKAKISAKKKYCIKDDEKVLLFLANVRRFKRVDIVLKAIKILSEHNKKVKLVVVGNDYLASEKFATIKEMSKDLGITDKVVLTGWLSPSDTRTIMNISDMCLNSSIHEGQCLVVYEAAAAGLPLCLSSIGSFTSVFTKSALFHEPEDAEKLAKNIEFYIKNPKIAKKHSDINKKIVKERCDYRVVEEELAKLFTIKDNNNKRDIK